MKKIAKRKFEIKKFIYIGLAVFLTIIIVIWRFTVFISKTNNELPGNMGIYPVENSEMELLIPESWSKFKDLSGDGQNKYIIAEFGSSSTKSTIIIEKYEMSSPNLNDLRQINDKQIGGLSGIDLIDDTEKSIGKTDGVLREYVFTRQLVVDFYKSHCYAWLFIKNRFGYVITLCSEDKIWENINPDYIKIIESINY